MKKNNHAAIGGRAKSVADVHGVAESRLWPLAHEAVFVIRGLQHVEGEYLQPGPSGKVVEGEVGPVGRTLTFCIAEREFQGRWLKTGDDAVHPHPTGWRGQRGCLTQTLTGYPTAVDQHHLLRVVEQQRRDDVKSVFTLMFTVFDEDGFVR
ncbi:MAG: hypothetical protein P8045_11425 [Candidatus Thiodiazotropha sp.]